MGDAEYLSAATELAEFAAHDLGHAPSDARIDFVEHECGNRGSARANDLDREADS